MCCKWRTDRCHLFGTRTGNDSQTESSWWFLNQRHRSQLRIPSNNFLKSWSNCLKKRILMFMFCYTLVFHNNDERWRWYVLPKLKTRDYLHKSFYQNYVWLKGRTVWHFPQVLHSMSCYWPHRCIPNNLKESGRIADIQKPTQRGSWC